LLNLFPGANLLAWPGANRAPGQAISGVQATNLRMVYEWDPASGEWHRWSPLLPAFANNLQMMRSGASYWFIAIAALQMPVP
jgi:hypothetical protein